MRQPGELTDRATLRSLHADQYDLSLDTANEIMAHHNLPPVRALKRLEGYFTNTNYEAEPDTGDPIIIKIEHRPGFGSLETERSVNSTLKQATDLPVADLLLLDTSCTLIPHAYLITEKLPGEHANTVFEQSDHETRMEIIRLMGEVVGAIHTMDRPVPGPLRQFDLNRWHELVEEGLLSDEAFKAEIDAFDPTFYPRFKELMATADAPPIEEPPAFIWTNPALGNMLVSRNGSTRISGVFDFQTAAFGQRSLDYMYAEGDFGRNRPDDGYGHPDYPAQFYQGYQDAGGAYTPPDENTLIVRELVLRALNPRVWWNMLGILHPLMPGDLEATLEKLTQLSR